MTTIQIVLISIASFIFVSLIIGIIITLKKTLPIAKTLYKTQWIRENSDDLKRECSDPTIDYHLDMFNKGLAFREQYIKNIKELKLFANGINQYGEYYDLGFDKCVVLLPGRTETAYYGAYYAPVFIEAGYNVFLPDLRANGLSEGKEITLGKLESLDAIEWINKLVCEYKIKDVVVYGLCGGATACCLLLNNPKCPSEVKGFIADGMYYTFYHTYKRHINEKKHPSFPVLQEVFHYIKKYNNVNPYKMAPRKFIKKITIPTLILSGTKDVYSYTSEAKKMYNSCPAKDKQLVYIDNARHSHLRYDNMVDYDASVKSFLKYL